jgi:hypothetical protein
MTNNMVVVVARSETPSPIFFTKVDSERIDVIVCCA